ncbi:DNA-binding protein [Ostreiculturibacter nitratireducens]|uniref:DNA-binding protein n=1 Tax=Ostreiculturibacter nitratireducens TaxID=3075226 RepID=UPI0031B5B807
MGGTTGAASGAKGPEDRAVPEENRRIAGMLSDYADLLDEQGEDGFRIRAYRAASETVGAETRPLRDIHDEGGQAALVAMPTIGKGIAGAIAEMLRSGRWAQLDRLKGELSPEKLFRTLPGIGPKLAETLADDYGLESLEQLETALSFGTPKIAGIGPRRRKALLAVLADRLGRPLQRRRAEGVSEPPVAMLLEADALYRDRAAAGKLRKIAPKRFNPSGEAWLPIMHAREGDWHFTVLYSNTELAHRLGRTDDWVVIYFQEGEGPEGRCTIVTETRGELEGRRVVRGREEDCAEHYAGSG